MVFLVIEDEAAETVVKKIPDIKFLLVGNGDNENEIKIEDLKYILADNIDYKEVVDINTTGKSSIWPSAKIIASISVAGDDGVELDLLYSLSPQIVLAFQKWALDQLSEIRKHPELFNNALDMNMYFEKFNPSLLNIESNFIRL